MGRMEGHRELPPDDLARRAQCVIELEIDLERMGLYDHPDPGAIQAAVEEAIEGAQFYAGPQRVPYRVTGVRVMSGQIATGSR